MSGGIDSSTAALLLRDAGYTVVGVTFGFQCGACGGRDLSDDPSVIRARSVCGTLGIEHRAVDLTGDFRTKVVEDFIGEYRAGRTPNPCVTCNEKLKFPSIAAVAASLGAARIATGHYARTARDVGSRVWLEMSADRAKDQSYFLYRVPVDLLERCVFPLGNTTKEDVRKIAEEAGLSASTGRESQDICFIPGGDLPGFLSSYIEPDPGEVVDACGNVVGTHNGVFRYTVGQRKGLGISGASPMYVCSVDPAANRIVLAENDRLFSRSATCSRLRMRIRRPGLPLKARIRYRHGPAEVGRIEVGGGICRVVFVEEQRAVTPGQSLVLYSGTRIIGGGIITAHGKDG